MYTRDKGGSNELPLLFLYNNIIRRIYMVYLVATIRKSNNKIVGVRLLDTEKGTTLDADYLKTVKTVANGKSKIKNVRVHNNELIGTNCEIDRYTKIKIDGRIDGKERIVILSEGKDGTFTVCNYKGTMNLINVETLVDNLDNDMIANLDVMKEVDEKEFIFDDIDKLVQRIAGVTRLGDKTQDEYFEYTLIKEAITGTIGWRAKFIGGEKAICENKINGYPVISMQEAFMGCKSTSLDLKGMDTSNVVDMSYMFYKCKAKCININSFDTTKVVTMAGMFEKCEAVDYKLSSINTSHVKRFNSMFADCKAQLLDLRCFDTSEACSMSYMFSNCVLKELSIITFVTDKVEDITGMFCGVKIDKLVFGDFNTSKVKYMSELFCASTIADVDIDKIDCSNAVETDGIFDNCKIEAIKEIAITK